MFSRFLADVMFLEMVNWLCASFFAGRGFGLVENEFGTGYDLLLRFIVL